MANVAFLFPQPGVFLETLFGARYLSGLIMRPAISLGGGGVVSMIRVFRQTLADSFAGREACMRRHGRSYIAYVPVKLTCAANPFMKVSGLVRAPKCWHSVQR